MINQNTIDDVIEVLQAELTQGEVGTGTTAPSINDTDLESPISGTLQAVSDVTTTSNSIQIVYSLSTSQANGNDITEFGLKNNGGTLKLRTVTSTVSKTSDISLDFITGILVETTSL